MHENDKDKGGCSFNLIWDQTPPELLNPHYKLYDEIAVPLYSLNVYRQASLRLLVEKMVGPNTRLKRLLNLRKGFRTRTMNDRKNVTKLE